MNRYTQWLNNFSQVQPYFDNNTAVLPRNMKAMIQGAPFYVEAIRGGGEIRGEVGGFLSDHGSVSGLKCGTDHTIQDLFFDKVHPLHIALYSAFRIGKKTDRFIINVVSQKRRIHFYPWGWEEVSLLPKDVVLHAKVFTHLERDRHVLMISFLNPTPPSKTIELPFCLSLSHVEDHEGMVSFDESAAVHQLQDIFPNYVVYEYQSGPSQLQEEKFVRCLYCDIPFHLQPTQKIFKSPHALFGKLDPLELKPNKPVEFSFHIFTKRTRSHLDDAMGPLATPQKTLRYAVKDKKIFEQTEALWAQRFEKAPPLPVSTPEAVHVYGLALTHALMNLRPPSSEGPQVWSSSPARGHFDQHWAWDTPYQAWTYSLITPAVAFDHMRLQTAILRKFGYLPYWTPIDLHHKHWLTRWGLRLLGISMPPVQGEVIRNLIYAQAPQDPTWIQDTYDLLVGQVKFWSSRVRPPHHDSLHWWKAPLESGWDDTPVLTFATKERDVVPFYRMAFSRLVLHEYIPFRPQTYHVDASVFYADLLVSLKWFQKKFSSTLPQDPGFDVGAALTSLRKKINDTFWNAEDGLYYNLHRGQPVKIKTPISFWPVAFGVCSSFTQVKSVIENHILNPTCFWGSYGIPSVAFNETKYFNSKNRGYYWRGSIWPLISFYAAKALSAHGYVQESEELVRRLCHLMVSADPGGLHENYDSLEPRVGYGCGTGKGGIGEPSAFGQGFTNLAVFLLLLRFQDHQKFIYDTPECRNNHTLEGYIHHVFQDVGGQWQRILKIQPEHFPTLPHCHITSPQATDSLCHASQWTCQLHNPYEHPIQGQLLVGNRQIPYQLSPGSTHPQVVTR